jgi:hypothetical protein
VKQNIPFQSAEDGLTRLFLHHRDDLIEMKSIRQEKTRLEVQRAFLDEIIRCLREYIQGMKVELVFNLGEVGMSEWEDRNDKRMIFSKTMDERTTHHRVSRNVKYISIVTCISAREESLTPYVVILQDSEPLRKKLMHHDIRLGVDFVLRQRLKPYMNSTLFLK